MARRVTLRLYTLFQVLDSKATLFFSDNSQNKKKMLQRCARSGSIVTLENEQEWPVNLDLLGPHARTLSAHRSLPSRWTPVLIGLLL
jgi:hypothetical protein